MHLLTVAENRIKELYELVKEAAEVMQNSSDDPVSDAGYELEAIIEAAQDQRLIERLRSIHAPYETNKDVGGDWHPHWRPPSVKAYQKFVKHHRLTDLKVGNITGLSVSTTGRWRKGQLRIPFACWRLLVHHACMHNVYMAEKTYAPLASIGSKKKSWRKLRGPK